MKSLLSVRKMGTTYLRSRRTEQENVFTFESLTTICEHSLRWQSKRAKQPRASLEKQRDALWQLLDNIDTLDDACREHDDAFRNFSRKHLRARFEIYNPEGEKQ